jgi:hypothetical protein
MYSSGTVDHGQWTLAIRVRLKRASNAFFYAEDIGGAALNVVAGSVEILSRCRMQWVIEGIAPGSGFIGDSWFARRRKV